MTLVRIYTTRSIVIFILFVHTINADLHDFMKFQLRKNRLEDTKFGYSEYSEYSDNDERHHGPESQWNQIPHRNVQPPRFNHPATESPLDISDAVDPKIAWDTAHWTEEMNIGQLSAVDVDPKGNVAIFSRGERIWGLGTFDYHDKFDCGNGPIKQNVIFLFDKFGKKILQWGKGLFYLPHGLTIDTEGNYWLTDVALHQVFKFDGKDIEKNWDRLKNDNENVTMIDVRDHQSRFNRSILKPSMILGEAFQPGDDNQRFCKPTAVAVAKNGDFFVSDGYCNSRVIKFNKEGVRILHWGRAWSAADNMNKSPPTYALFVPHALALAEEQNLIYVADREDGRVMSYNAQNGTFHREYKHPAIGTKVYSIDYAREKLYLVNGPDVYTSHKFHVRGFVIDVNTGEIASQFTPGRSDMMAPHDIAVSDDGSEIYVVELDAHKVYHFTQDVTMKVSGNSHPSTGGNGTVTLRHHESIPLTDDSSTDVTTSGKISSGPLVLSILISAMLFIGLCLAVAAVVARCRKRGCLLSVRRRAYWEAEKRENFKLSSLLESRQGKSFKILEKRPNTRDFSKLNTEPETSEDEHVEDTLVI